MRSEKRSESLPASRFYWGVLCGSLATAALLLIFQKRSSQTAARPRQTPKSGEVVANKAQVFELEATLFLPESSEELSFEIVSEPVLLPAISFVAPLPSALLENEFFDLHSDFELVEGSYPSETAEIFRSEEELRDEIAEREQFHSESHSEFQKSFELLIDESPYGKEVPNSWHDDEPTEKINSVATKRRFALQTTGLQDQDVWASILEGERLAGLKKYREAERIYQKLLKLYPEEVRLYNAMGTLFAGEEKYDEAEKAWLKANELNPTTETYNYLGSVWESQKRYDEAVGAYQKALELNPNDVMARSSLGWLYASQKKYSNARKEFVKYQKDIDPTEDISQKIGRKRV